MSSAAFTATIIAVHAQYLDRDRRKPELFVIFRHPVAKIVLYVPLILCLAGALVTPAADRILAEIVKKTIITAPFALP